jgi:hypothetical protein
MEDREHQLDLGELVGAAPVHGLGKGDDGDVPVVVCGHDYIHLR